MEPISVSIYAPLAESFYESGNSERPASGGAEYQTTKLAAGLAERGFAVSHIVYPVQQPDPERVGRVRLVIRSPYRGEGGLLSKLREAMAIWRALAMADAHVYILRGFGLHIPVGVLFGKLRRRKVIFSGSNDIDFTPEARGSSRGLVAAIYRRAIGGADQIIAQTDQQAEIARRRFPGRPIEVIRSFCEPAEPAGKEAEPPFFFWVGRLVDYKRPFAFLDLARAVPEAGFRMLYVPTGETPSEMTARLVNEAAGISNLELVSPRPRPQVLEITARATAMVLTSEAEGMPNVLLEAWMRGVPALSLSFDPDGIIRRHELGIVADDDPERMASAARQLLEDHERRRRMGQNGRDFVMNAHSPEAVAGLWSSAIFRLS